MTSPQSFGDDTHVATLPNGVRVLTIRLPQARTAAVSAFVRCGSAHESRAENGICHVVEHLVYKGSATRDARRINLDAEQLGAEVNAHTDKDHTAFHLRGLAGHVPDFIAQLGDLLGAPAFPADELERERQVLLHECTEDEDDPMSSAFKLFDRACFGSHGAAQAVIGPRRNLERVTREQLAAWVQAKYTGTNLVVAAIGPLDPAEVVRAAEAAFGGFAPGTPNLVPPAHWVGGLAAQRDAGSSQAHAVIGWPIAPAAQEDPAATVAAAVLGEGMSSPLLHRIREQKGLAYYTHCSADVLEHGGQFVVEASTGPKQWEELVASVIGLVREQAARVDPADLARALNQLRVRRLRDDERPQRRLESAALDLFVHGRVRPAAETLAAWEAVTAAEVEAAFQRMLAAGTTVALAGELPRAATQRLKEVVAQALA